MFKSLKNQVLIEIVTAPLTLGLFTLGCSLILCSPFSRWCLFFGILSTISSVGTALSNFFLNKEKIASKALRKVFEKDMTTRSDQIVLLMKKLKKTTEPNDDKCLNDLGGIYFDFLQDVQENKIQNIPDGLLEQLEQLFTACMKNLEYSFTLYEQARKLSPDLRKKAVEKRDQVIGNVNKNIASMFDIVGQLRMMGLQDNSKELDKVRSRVERSLKLAKEIDSICEGEDAKYEEYVKES